MALRVLDFDDDDFAADFADDYDDTAVSVVPDEPNDTEASRADVIRALRSQVEEASDAIDLVAAMEAQMEALHDAMNDAEERAVPEDTVLYGAITLDTVRSRWREISGKQRGPLPTAVLVALDENADEIIAAMTAAAAPFIDQAIQNA